MGADTYTLFSEKEGGPNRRDGHFGGKCGILDMQDFLIRCVGVQRLQRQNCPPLLLFCGGDTRAAIARIPHAGQLPPGVGIFYRRAVYLRALAVQLDRGENQPRGSPDRGAGENQRRQQAGACLYAARAAGILPAAYSIIIGMRHSAVIKSAPNIVIKLPCYGSFI